MKRYKTDILGPGWVLYDIPGHTGVKRTNRDKAQMKGGKIGHNDAVLGPLQDQMAKS